MQVQRVRSLLPVATTSHAASTDTGGEMDEEEDCGHSHWRRELRSAGDGGPGQSVKKTSSLPALISAGDHPVRG